MKKRILSMVLAIVMMAGMLPGFMLEASAADTDKTIQLVNNGSAVNISGGQTDSVYFGTYKQSSDGNGGYNNDPIKWRVLSNSDGKLFLLSDQNLDCFDYHNENESVTWETSTMRSWLNGYAASSNTGGDSGIDYSSNNFLNNAFSTNEQTAIATTYVYNATRSDGISNPNSDYDIPGGNDTNDKIFLLSIEEASNNSYFPDGASSRIATNTAYVAGGGEISSSIRGQAGKADYWWLRSPGLNDSSAACMAFDGYVNNAGGSVSDSKYAVRPAFNLKLATVLFTSAADDSAQEDFAAIAEYSGSEWKLTIKDSNDFSINASVSGSTTLRIGYEETALTVNHAALNSFTEAGYTNVTAMLTDAEGNVLYYGSINNDTSATSSTVTIPAGLSTGEYNLSVYGEDWNGGKCTDYATGTPFSTKITVYTPDALTGTVTVTGKVAVGETLTATLTDTNNTGELSYQWYRYTNIMEPNVISGATSNTYTITTDDVQNTIYCEVASSVQTGTRSGGHDLVPFMKFTDNEIVAEEYSGTYDGQSHGITVTVPDGATVTYSSTSNGTRVTELTYKDAGTYKVWFFVEKTGYNTYSGLRQIQIDKAVLDVTADNLYAEVDRSIPTPTYTISGFVNGENEGNVAITGTPILKYPETLDMSREGTYTVEVDTSGMSAANYEFNGICGSLTVLEHVHEFTDYYLNGDGDTIYGTCSKADCHNGGTVKLLTIVAPEDAVYEQGVHHTVSIEGYDPQVQYDSDAVVYMKDGVEAEPVSAGTYKASITYQGLTASVTYTVEKRNLTVTADDKMIYVGDGAPIYTYTISGWGADYDAEDEFSHKVSGVRAVCENANLNKAGTYAITISGTSAVLDSEGNDVSANYVLKTQDGVLKVKKHKTVDEAEGTNDKNPEDNTKNEEAAINPVNTAALNTGDNSSLWMWFALLVVSGIGLLGVIVYNRKRKVNTK